MRGNYRETNSLLPKRHPPDSRTESREILEDTGTGAKQSKIPVRKRFPTALAVAPKPQRKKKNIEETLRKNPRHQSGQNFELKHRRRETRLEAFAFTSNDKLKHSDFLHYIVCP